jgi:hypothetical protein
MVCVWRERRQFNGVWSSCGENTSKAQLLQCDSTGWFLSCIATETNAGNATTVVRYFKARMESKELFAGQDFKYINLGAGDRYLDSLWEIQ